MLRLHPKPSTVAGRPFHSYQCSRYNEKCLFEGNSEQWLRRAVLQRRSPPSHWIEARKEMDAFEVGTVTCSYWSWPCLGADYGNKNFTSRIIGRRNPNCRWDNSYSQSGLKSSCMQCNSSIVCYLITDFLLVALSDNLYTAQLWSLILPASVMLFITHSTHVWCTKIPYNIQLHTWIFLDLVQSCYWMVLCVWVIYMLYHTILFVTWYLYGSVKDYSITRL